MIKSHDQYYRLRTVFLGLFLLHSSYGHAGFRESFPFTTDFTSGLKTTLTAIGLDVDRSTFMCRPITMLGDTDKTRTWFLETTNPAHNFYFFYKGNWRPGLNDQEVKSLETDSAAFRPPQQEIDAHLSHILDLRRSDASNRLRETKLLRVTPIPDLSEARQNSDSANDSANYVKITLDPDEKNELTKEYINHARESFILDKLREYYIRAEGWLQNPKQMPIDYKIPSNTSNGVHLENNSTHRKVAELDVVGDARKGKCPDIKITDSAAGSKKSLLLTDESGETSHYMKITYTNGSQQKSMSAYESLNFMSKSLIVPASLVDLSAVPTINENTNELKNNH